MRIIVESKITVATSIKGQFSGSKPNYFSNWKKYEFYGESQNSKADLNLKEAICVETINATCGT